MVEEIFLEEDTVFTEEELKSDGIVEITLNKKETETLGKIINKDIDYKKKVNKTLLKLDNYVDNVNIFYDHNPFFYDKSNLWWLWDKENLNYVLVDEVDILNKIDEELEFGGQAVTNRFRGNYLNAFKSVGRKHLPKNIPVTWVQFKNGIFDFKTDEMITPTPEYFSCNVIPHTLGVSEETPILDKIFTEWVGSDKIQMLYEIIAFSMIPDYPLQRIFALIGGGSNGKSCYLNVLKNTIGIDNCASVELERLVKTFGTTNLYKKLVCLMGETNFDRIDKTGIIKRLSGNDLIEFEFKGKNIFSAHNYAKLLIATNSLPVSADKTWGFYRRWIVVPFENIFNEKKDIMEDIPPQEYNNLCFKCLRLIKLIIKQRAFTGEVSVEEKQKEYEKHSNPLLHFIESECFTNPDIKTPTFEFYDRLCTYLQQRSKRVMSKKEVSMLMKNEGFDIKPVWITDQYNNEKQWKHFIGVGFKEKVTDVTDVTLLSTSELPHRNEHKTTVTSVTSVTKPFSQKNLTNDTLQKLTDAYFTPCKACGTAPCHYFDDRHYFCSKPCSEAYNANNEAK